MVIQLDSYENPILIGFSIIKDAVKFLHMMLHNRDISAPFQEVTSSFIHCSGMTDAAFDVVSMSRNLTCSTEHFCLVSLTALLCLHVLKRGYHLL